MKKNAQVVHNKPIVRYVSYDNTIRFPSKINAFIVADFSAAINEWLRRRRHDLLTLDFSAVKQPYSNGIVPIIATVDTLRLHNHKFKIVLPNDAKARKWFLDKNWAFYLDPTKHKRSEILQHRHMVIQQFREDRDLAMIVKEFMDVVLRSMEKIPLDVFQALEWSVHEICDNVLNHSNSKIGGFVEMATHTKMGLITFTVADAGRGILHSLKEGFPELTSDVQAIGEAIKAGVTRNKQFGQGNGLAGSLNITTMTGGSLDITSGTGRFYATPGASQKYEVKKNQSYRGTVVSGTIKINKQFVIAKALNFGQGLYTAVDVIETDYEMPDQDCLQLLIKNETTGFGTRNAGKQLRTKVLNLLHSRPGFPMYVDWDGIPVISSSFADEFMGKLFLELGPMRFVSIIRNKNMLPLITQLLDKAITQRLTQAKDDPVSS